jgi:hypothetical protein
VHEEALAVVVAVDEPAGDVVGFVAADFTGGGVACNLVYWGYGIASLYSSDSDAIPEKQGQAGC